MELLDRSTSLFNNSTRKAKSFCPGSFVQTKIAGYNGTPKCQEMPPSNALENETYTSFSKTNRPDSREVCVTPCTVTEKQNAAYLRSATPLAIKRPFTSFQSRSSCFDTFLDQPGYNLQQASSF